MKETFVCKVLKFALYIVFTVGFVGAVSLPFLADFYVQTFFSRTNISAEYQSFVIPFLVSVAPFCLWIVLEMIWLMRTIPKGPFVMRNVRALHRIGVVFLILSAAFLSKCFFFFTYLTLFCAILFVGAGLFAFTLAALIGQSIAFKEENDLTI